MVMMIRRSHDRTPREIPVESTGEINTLSEEAGGVTAELGVAANETYCINQSDTWPQWECSEEGTPGIARRVEDKSTLPLLSN